MKADLIKIAPIRDVASAEAVMLGAAELRAEKALVYSNLRKFDEALAERWESNLYQKRNYDLLDITIFALRGGWSLRGGSQFVLERGGVVVAEQISHVLRDDREKLAGLFTAKPVVAVDVPCVLAARYGIATWGHWLGEILPKIVCVESFYPNRFNYVLPYHFETSNPSNLWFPLRMSLEYYGIGLNRIYPVREDTDYHFSELRFVSPIWSDGMMHPGAASLMRAAGAKQTLKQFGGKRVALLRTESSTRRIRNVDEVARYLGESGYEMVEVGKMPFGQQVQLFECAESVCSVLGSGLTGIIYAREGISVASLAPYKFGDSFFYNLVRMRRGYFAEIRGKITTRDSRHEHWSEFEVNMRDLQEGLLALNSARVDRC